MWGKRCNNENVFDARVNEPDGRIPHDLYSADALRVYVSQCTVWIRLIHTITSFLIIIDQFSIFLSLSLAYLLFPFRSALLYPLPQFFFCIFFYFKQLSFERPVLNCYSICQIFTFYQEIIHSFILMFNFRFLFLLEPDIKWSIFMAWVQCLFQNEWNEGHNTQFIQLNTTKNMSELRRSNVHTIVDFKIRHSR